MQPELQPIRTGETGPVDSLALRQQKVLRNTYLLLAITLIPTMIGAVIGTNIDFSFLRGSGVIAAFAIMAIFYGWIYAIEKNKETGMGVALLLGFTLFMGVLLGPLFQYTLGMRNGVQLIMMAAGGTAAAFFVLAGIATTTKRDLSGMGKFLSIATVVIMLGVIANIFMQSSGLYLLLAGVFILFSSAIILWQVNAIVKGGETNYISATLTLYIAIYNLFTSLLRILGFAGGNR